MLSEMPSQESQNRVPVEDNEDLGQWKPRWKLIFIWQCPIMFMSYSVCSFIAGLTLFVCSPLVHGDHWSTDSYVRITPSAVINPKLLNSTKIAVVYLVTGAITTGVFIFASFWIYHYVDLDHHSAREEAASEIEALMLRERSSWQYHHP